MKNILFLFILLFMSGCSDVNQGADGYYFGKKEYTELKPKIEVIVYASRKEFEEEFKNRKIEIRANSQIVAFTSLYPADRSRCTIHMIDPAVEYSPEFVGHEFLHCIYGQWHTSNLTNG